MKKKPVLSMAAALVLVSFSQIVPAAEAEHAGHGGKSQGMGGMKGGGMHEMMMEHMHEMHGGRHHSYGQVVLERTDELKLSDEQIGKITRMQQENQRKVGDVNKKLHESMRKAHEAFLNPASDEEAIRTAAKEHAAAFDELVETTLKARNAINGILTPEQLQKLKSSKTKP
jgi:protein CpxP